MNRFFRTVFSMIAAGTIFFVATLPAQTPVTPPDLSGVDEILGVTGSQETSSPRGGDDLSKPELDTTSATNLQTAESPPKKSSATSMGGLIRAGGWVGLLIFLMSLVAVALGIEFTLTLRRRKLLPDRLIAEFGPFMEKGRLQSAMDACDAHPSFLATILAGGLKNFEGGWPDVEKGAEETLAAETARLYRKTEFLAVIGNIAPMLGLLGTVLGMVMAFGELASADGLGRFANLAQGIYFALVTTVDGLVVAIPTLAAYSWFNHRVATCSADAAALTEELFRPLKRYFLTRGDTAPMAAPAAPNSPSTAPISTVPNSAAPPSPHPSTPPPSKSHASMPHPSSHRTASPNPIRTRTDE